VTLLIEILIVFFVTAGVGFMLLSAIGLVKLKGFFMRVHAPTKAATLGIVCLMIAVALSLQEWGVFLRAVAGVLFFTLTAPVGAHLLARSAYRDGLR